MQREFRTVPKYLNLFRQRPKPEAPWVGFHSVKVMRAGPACCIRTRSSAVVSILHFFHAWADLEVENPDFQRQGDKTSVLKLCTPGRAGTYLTFDP